jgi:Family of unknown function (DUF6159)
MDRRPMTVSQAFGHARSRVWTIAWWALVATSVGVALRALEQLPAGGWVRQIVEWIVDVAWSLATFFVVPVLALEDVGVRTALRRSAATIRRTWGESVTGAIAIGGVLFVSGLALLAVGAAGVAVGTSGRLQALPAPRPPRGRLERLGRSRPRLAIRPEDVVRRRQVA